MVDFTSQLKKNPSPANKEVMDSLAALPKDVYFYSDIPTTSFVLPMPWDRRFSLGNPVKHWLITSKMEEIDYIRNNFSPESAARLGRNASSIVIYEKTKEDYDVFLGLVDVNKVEHNPELEEARRAILETAGIVVESPPLKPEHTPVFDYKGADHPTLEQRLAQTEMITKATEALQKE